METFQNQNHHLNFGTNFGPKTTASRGSHHSHKHKKHKHANVHSKYGGVGTDVADAHKDVAFSDASKVVPEALVPKELANFWYYNSRPQETDLDEAAGSTKNEEDAKNEEVVNKDQDEKPAVISKEKKLDRENSEEGDDAHVHNTLLFTTLAVVFFVSATICGYHFGTGLRNSTHVMGRRSYENMSKRVQYPAFE